MRSVSKLPPRALDASTRTLGPSPRVGFVRTLARVTPSPTSTSTTLIASVRPQPAQVRALGAPPSSATARVVTPKPVHRSKPAPPPSASTARPAARTTTLLPASSSSAPPPLSASRPVFGSRAAPPQPSSALKARPAGPPSALKPSVSQLPKPSSSGIPKPASMLPKGPSARLHSTSSLTMTSSSRALVGGASSSARPKQALKTFGSWSSAGGSNSSVRRVGGDSSMYVPVSVGGGAFARGLESESSFRMDSSFRMESPRPSRPNLGEVSLHLFQPCFACLTNRSLHIPFFPACSSRLPSQRNQRSSDPFLDVRRTHSNELADQVFVVELHFFSRTFLPLLSCP